MVRPDCLSGPAPSHQAERRVSLSRDVLALPCIVFKTCEESWLNSLYSPLSLVRAELVEKWKADREARLARGEREEEEEEEEEINIYAVTEEEVLGDSEGSPMLWGGGEDARPVDRGQAQSPALALPPAEASASSPGGWVKIAGKVLGKSGYKSPL